MKNYGDLYWKGFKLTDGKQRWLCTSDADQVKILKAEWFNQQTEYVVIHKGCETAESSTTPHIWDCIYNYCCVFGQKLFWRQKWTPLQKQGLCLQRWNIV